jgi:hypothetical protein
MEEGILGSHNISAGLDGEEEEEQEEEEEEEEEEEGVGCSSVAKESPGMHRHKKQIAEQKPCHYSPGSSSVGSQMAKKWGLAPNMSMEKLRLRGRPRK